MMASTKEEFERVPDLGTICSVPPTGVAMMISPYRMFGLSTGSSSAYSMVMWCQKEMSKKPSLVSSFRKVAGFVSDTVKRRITFTELVV